MKRCWLVLARKVSYGAHVDVLGGGGRWCSWLRCCAANRKVSGSIPSGLHRVNLIRIAILFPSKFRLSMSLIFYPCTPCTLRACRILFHVWSRYYLLTPWCRVLLEKLIGLQLGKKFPAFYGTRRFITALTSFHHSSLSWASPIQSTYLQPTSWRSILILSTHLRPGLPSGLFRSGFPTRTLYASSPPPYDPHAQPISFFSILSPAQY